MSKFRVELKRNVSAKLIKLPKAQAERIIEALLKLENNPLPPGKKVKPFIGRPKTFRLRVGDHRIIYMVEKSAISVLEILHRRDLDKFFK